MATTFIEGLKVRAGRTRSVTIRDALAYIKNPLKTDNGRWLSAHSCSPATAAEEMELLQDAYEQETGRKVNQPYGGNREASVLVSIRQSFLPGEVDAATAHEIGLKLAERFIGAKYQYVVATHVNTPCLHNHIMFNIVGDDSLKYHMDKFTYRELRGVSDRLSREYSISIVVPAQKRRSQLYTGRRQTPFRTILKNDLDRCLRQAASYDELLQLMRHDYVVLASGKYLSFRHRTNGQQKNLRAYSLGEAYTEQALRLRVKNGGLFVPDFGANEPLGRSKTLRNIESEFHAVGLLRDMEITRFGDFQDRISGLSAGVAETQKEMSAAQGELDRLESLLNHIDTTERYAGLHEEQAGALLPERFYLAHREELDAYDAAAKALSGAGVTQENKDALEKQLDELQTKLAPLFAEFMAVQDKIAQVNEVQRMITRVYADEKINQGKGGAAHDR